MGDFAIPMITNQAPTILMIDDEVDFLDIFSMWLKRAGFQVETAVSAAEGLARAKELRPQLILMDVNIPDMNSIEAFFKLRADPVTKDIKVMFLTNMGDALPVGEDSEAKVSNAPGAFGYLHKTDDLNSIVEKIRVLLS